MTIVNDPISDMLARIRNASMRSKAKVAIPPSKLRERVLEVLAKEGYIRGFATIEKDGKSEIEVELKYFDGAPVIKHMSRVSKPGRRVYASVSTLPSVFNGLGISILSTPKGVMSDQDAKAQNVGGEVLCTIF